MEYDINTFTELWVKFYFLEKKRGIIKKSYELLACCTFSNISDDANVCCKSIYQQ